MTHRATSLAKQDVSKLHGRPAVCCHYLQHQAVGRTRGMHLQAVLHNTQHTNTMLDNEDTDTLGQL